MPQRSRNIRRYEGLPTRSRHRGFTLVELMIAMTVGLFISGGILALFLGTKQSYRVNETMSRLQETGRFAIEFLSRDARQAGYRDVLLSSPPVNLFIEGWEGGSAPPSGKGLTNYIPNTDIFKVRHASLPANPGVHDIYYYIGSSASGGVGLRQKIDSGSTQELLEDVVDMQVNYGLDTTGNGDGISIDSYADAAEIDANASLDWDQVLAIRIDLLLRSSEDNLAETEMSLPFQSNDGTFFSAAPGDRRIYQMFSTTIVLRNRIN